MKKIIYWIVIILFFGLISIIPYIPLPVQLSPKFTQYFIYIYRALVMVIPFLFIVGLLLSAIIILFVRKRKIQGIKLLFFMIAMVVLCLINSYLLTPKMRDYGKAYTINKATPIVEALTEFKYQTGDFPNDLKLLVPKHLQKIPSSKIPTIRAFKYVKNNQNDYCLYFIQQINDWDVEIVFFKASSNYSDIENLRRFGDWRYTEARYFKHF